jgi:hypothetical protein
MPNTTLHEHVEARVREAAQAAGLPEPDEVAHLTRCVIFLWYRTKAFVLVDLEEMPPGADPLEGLDLDQLAFDLRLPDRIDLGPPRGGFAETG